jgi:hypothetical protein
MKKIAKTVKEKSVFILLFFLQIFEMRNSAWNESLSPNRSGTFC